MYDNEKYVHVLSTDPVGGGNVVKMAVMIALHFDIGIIEASL